MPNQDVELAGASYYEVQQERARTERFNMFAFVSRKFFQLVNALLTIVFICGLLTISFTDAFPMRIINVTMYCDNPDYNFNTTPQPFGLLEISLVLSIFILRSLEVYAHARIQKCKPREIAKRLLRSFWLLGMHLIFLTICIFMLKLSFGIPRPYFFQNEEVKIRHCGTTKKRFSGYFIREHEQHLRTSFPSLRSSFYGFTLTFLYLYIDNLHQNNGLHGLEQFIFIVPGIQVWNNILALLENADNHLTDIIVGVVIGAIQAIFAIRSIFGTAFRDNMNINNGLNIFTGP